MARARPRSASPARARGAGSGAGARPVALPPDGRISLLKDGQLASPFGSGWIPSSDRLPAASRRDAGRAAGGPAPKAARRVAAIDAQVKPGFAYPWAGTAFLPGAQPMLGADLCAAKVIRFRVRGDGRRYTVSMASTGMSIPRTVAFEAGAEWKEVTIPFSGLYRGRSGGRDHDRI